jgi:WD40 repeat protein
MLLAYYPPIDSHALHVYESAVATMPECALFATVDTGTAANVHLIAHRQGSWPATLRVIEVGRSSALLGGVSSLSFSPDGTQLASRSDFNKLKIWSVKTGAQLAVFEMAGRHSRISEQAETHHLIFDTCVAYSPDGTQIVFSFSSGSIVWLALWDTKTYQQLAVLRDPRDSMGQAVTRRLPISFLPGSSLVIFGCDDGTIYVWDPAGNIGTMRFGRNTTSKVWAVACSPNGSKIVSGLANGLLRVWHSETGARLATLEGHSEKVNSVAFSPNGAQLVSGSDDWSIRIWDMRMNEIICVLQSHGYPVTPMVQSPEVTSVAFSPDGRQVVSGSCDKTVRIWDVQSTKQITLLQGHHKEVLSVSFSPDGTLVASGAADGTMWVWDMQTLPPVVDIPEDPNREPTHEIAISTNGAHLVSTAGILGRVWDMQSRREIAVLDGHTDIIWVVSFSPDSNGLRIVTGSRDKTVRVWYTQTGQELARFSVNNRPSAVALSADGTRVVVGMDNARMPVWDVLSGEQLALLVGHRDEMLAVALSPDGLRVVSRSTKTTRLWDVATGDQVAVIGGRDNFSSTVTFCPDGLRVISCSYAGLIQAWDTITRAHIALVEGLDCSVTVVAHSFKDVWFHTPGRVLRLTFDSGDIMIYQHGDDMPSFEDVDDTQSTASRINASPMGKPARSAITWDQATGWLLCGSVPNGPIPLCWLPVERRGPAMICGRMVAVGGAGGKLTMLDFTQTIERLHNQGIVQSP